MGLIIDLGQVLKIQVRVDLCRADIRMPQQLLNGTKIGRGFKHMRGKGMPEHVGMQRYIQALASCSLAKALLNTTMRYTFTLFTHEQGQVITLDQGVAHR